jgi:hypothetical protein
MGRRIKCRTSRVLSPDYSSYRTSDFGAISIGAVEVWRGRQEAKKRFRNNGKGSIYALKFSTLPEEFNAIGPAFGSPLASVDSYVP